MQNHITGPLGGLCRDAILRPLGGLCRDAEGGNPGGGMATMIDRFEGERQAALDFIEKTCADADADKRDLSKSEKETLTKYRARVAELDEQIKPMRDFAELRDAHRQGGSHYKPTAAPKDDDVEGGQGARSLGARTEDRGHKYETRGQVIVDQIMSDPRVSAEFSDTQRQAATGRLRGARLPYKGAPSDYLGQIRAAVPHQTTDETPGLLPTSIVGAVDNDLDASRPFIGSIGVKALAGIPGKTFERPYVSQHTQSGKQTAEKTQLPSRQFKVDSIPFAKETHGGWLNVSRQEIDWTSPAAWDALLTDLQDEYGIDSEDTTADAFVTAVTAGGNAVTGDLTTVQGVIKALYEAAAASYGQVRRLPDHIWMSLDMWAVIGAAIDQMKASTNGNGGGDSSVETFTGNLLQVPRVVVPSFAANTVVVGVASKTEFYEQRIGLLSAVEPDVLGVQIAYGGYFAYGTIRPKAFTLLTQGA